MKKINLIVLFGIIFIFSCTSTKNTAVVREKTEWLNVWLPETNKTGLPRVLLIGNSITRAYYPEVEQLLAGKAFVAQLATSKSLGDPALLLEVDLILKSGHFDVVHFNNGLHGWGYTEAQYRAAFPKLIKTIRKGAHGATLIWASATPVRQGEGMLLFDARTERIKTRNQIAQECIAGKNIATDDLFSLIVGHPEYYAGHDGTHLNPAGVTALAKQVAQVIENTVPVRNFLLPSPVKTGKGGDEQGLETGKPSLKQDSSALGEAMAGWWKKSAETVDERMAWYNEAKFGCFIHWGVYSVAGGEWKGKKVSGYSEHLMRKEQIPLDEYKEKLVYPFNPVKFDADEWMLHAKEAGMRYFIITAKHHDGFAMFPSEAYPYDIRLTKFGHDPMKELRRAAKKQGIKFGFYYSHAFDWEHPDAPGNDWMYNNPGGDKLLHGKQWWLSYPDFLKNAEKYVTEKSIPQITELIEMYQPDILWFDTPDKLPLYENIRILEHIRKIAPGVVVNGRLARFNGGNLGDYKNTGDRAAFFPSVSGFWESIPTTNESYGYSKHDLSHKSVGHFVRLLASAASKGGNILMNVGPMGNGAWDEKDVAIFKGVGKWLSVYGEAVYGSAKTGLPLQNWGVTTQKNGILYLHVFNYPKSGNLVVGGLTSDIDEAWIVQDKSKKTLTNNRLNDKDMAIDLPRTAPDSMNTVVAVKLKNKKAPYAVRLLEADSENIFYAFDAAQTGDGFKYGDGKPNRNYVAGWKNASQQLSWKFRTNSAAEFAVYIDYNTASDTETGTVALQTGGKTFTVNYSPFLEKNGYNTLLAGKIQLPEGEYSCTLKGINHKGEEFMRPIAVKLVANCQIK
jgi:alpha-L-fucosidase